MGRPDYLRRQFRLWSDSQASVLVVDGSKTGVADAEVGALASNLRYVHCPNVTYAERIRLAQRKVDTKYVALLADDDLFLESGLRTVVALLEAQPKAESGVGRTLRFHFSDGEFRGALRYTLDDHYPTIDGETDLTDYLLDNLTRQYSYYAVYRMASWSQSVAIAFARDYSSPYVSEIAFQFASAIRHNGAICDQLWWLRSDESAPVSTKDWDRKVSFVDWMDTPEFEDERRNLIDGLTTLGVTVGLWSETEGRQAVRQVLERHAAKAQSPARSTYQLTSKVLQRVGRKAGSRIRRLAKPLLPLQMSYSTGVGLDLHRLLPHLGSKGIAVDDSELRRVLHVLGGSDHRVEE
jgi:glycosyltransferase domain-containing protein